MAMLSISIPVHPSNYPTTTCYIEHLELTIRNLDRPEGRHAQEADVTMGRRVACGPVILEVPCHCVVEWEFGDGEWEALSCHPLVGGIGPCTSQIHIGAVRDWCQDKMMRYSRLQGAGTGVLGEIQCPQPHSTRELAEAPIFFALVTTFPRIVFGLINAPNALE